MKTSRNWLVCLTSLVGIFLLMFLANPAGKSLARVAGNPVGSDTRFSQDQDDDNEDQEEDQEDRGSEDEHDEWEGDHQDDDEGDFDEDWDDQEEEDDRWDDEQEEDEDEDGDEGDEGDGEGDWDEEYMDEEDFEFEREFAGLELERANIEYNIGRLEVISRLTEIAGDESAVAAYAIMHIGDLMESAEAMEVLESVCESGRNPTIRNLAKMKLAEIYAQEDRRDDLNRLFRSMLSVDSDSD